MVYGHEREIIVVVGFPKFSGDSQIVETVVWNKLVRADLVPLLGRGNASRSSVVDTQAQRGAPWHRILHETHPVSVKGKKKWAGTFQPLFGHHLLIGLQIKFGAHRSVRPHDPR